MSLMLEERPTPPAERAATQEVVVRVDQGRRRRFGLAGKALAVVLIVSVLAVGFVLARGWSGLSGLFGSRTIDRSAPVLVQRLRDQSTFTGADGTFSATVDLEHKVSVLPTFVAGSRAIYSGVGTADATVDLHGLDGALPRAADGSLVVRLPHARIGEVRLDARRSHVMNRDRGLLDRVGGVFVDSPTSEKELQQVAEQRIARAAARSNLRARAERNTATMIRDLARSLGAGPVDVRFGTA